MLRHFMRHWLPTVSVSVIVVAGSVMVSEQGLYSGDIGTTFGPVSGTCAFELALFDATAGGSQIGPVIESELRVRGGLYETELDFGPEAFDGGSHYLEVAVGCPAGTGSFTTLNPRQPLSAAPYALQTRGIFVDDAGEVGVGTTNPQAQLQVDGDGSTAVSVRNTAAIGGVGVYAFNEAESGIGYAIAAETASPDGIAIFGHASNGGQLSTGISVFGRSDGDDLAAGVYGESTASSGYSYGVRGVASAGDGVRGENPGSGNWGSLGSPTAGVAGHAAGSLDYAGHFTGGRNYFEGRVGIGTSSPVAEFDVSGDIHATGDYRLSPARTHHLQIPVSAFQRTNPDPEDGLTIEGSSAYFTSGSPPYFSALVAPVQLPDGAVVQEIRIYYGDWDTTADLDIHDSLNRYLKTSSNSGMMGSVSASTTGDLTAVQSAFDDTIFFETIDNGDYRYTVDVDFETEKATSFLKFFGCEIEYSISTVQP